LDATQVNHERLEYDIQDFIADVGGAYELLIRIATFIFGGFLAFNASIEMMNELCGDAPEPIEPPLLAAVESPGSKKEKVKSPKRRRSLKRNPTFSSYGDPFKKPKGFKSPKADSLKAEQPAG